VAAVPVATRLSGALARKRLSLARRTQAWAKHVALAPALVQGSAACCHAPALRRRTVLFQYGGPRLVERVGTSMGSESLVR